MDDPEPGRARGEGVEPHAVGLQVQLVEATEGGDDVGLALLDLDRLLVQRVGTRLSRGHHPNRVLARFDRRVVDGVANGQIPGEWLAVEQDVDVARVGRGVHDPQRGVGLGPVVGVLLRGHRPGGEERQEQSEQRQAAEDAGGRSLW